MPKVTVTNNKGLVQSSGNGLVVESNATLSSVNSLLYAVETLSTDAAAASTTIPVTILAHDGDEGVTLGDGSPGQIKIFISATENTVTLTPQSTGGGSNFGGNSATIATTTIGSCYTLIWTNALGWSLISRTSGDNANATAVAAMPVLAG